MKPDLIERLRAHPDKAVVRHWEDWANEADTLLREAAAALEAEASEAGCMCRGVEIGSHMASVSLPIPEHMADYREARVAAGLSPMISVDACLVVELRLLWSRGIRTYGCCCGHNKVRGMINAHEDDTAAMLAMGYEQWPEKDGMAVATFYPKSARGLASEGERRGLALVPREPTNAMTAAYFDEAGRLLDIVAYQAMLAAALMPEAPAQPELASAAINQISTPKVGLPEAPAEGWQPIETAPKDRAILVYDQGQGRCIAYWAQWHDNLLGEDREGWRTMGDWERLDWVTHWMAIPGPPLPHDSREG